MHNTLLILLCLACLPAFGQGTSAPPEACPAHRFSVGVLGTYQALGLQSDYRSAKRWGIKLAGARQFDYVRAGEYGLAGIGLVTYYLPTHSRLVEPLVGMGAVYSSYHWALAGRTGNVDDVNVGGGFGTNLRFSDRFKTGLNLFLVNGFRAEYAADDMVVTGRRLVIFPTLTLDVLL